jgi:alpha-methylacyl-CoA racemase
VKGPLKGLKVVEFAGLGPAPFCGMLLSDLGADVVRIDRKGVAADKSLTTRGRRSVALDLKRPQSIEVCLRLFQSAHIVFEGFRPGVMERLGLGPDVALGRNADLIYGRMTGWGQDGPYARTAGHDLNYIAISGALHGIGSKEKPHIPLNLIGDYAGGLYLAFGMLAALTHVRAGGSGQVVDCAMSEGAASLTTLLFGMQQMGLWSDERYSNVIDGAAHFYDTYQCADGKWITVAPLEPQFYAILRSKLGLLHADFDDQMDQTRWPALKAQIASVIASKSREQWIEILEGSDSCFAPVMSLSEAHKHPQNIARNMFVEIEGMIQPGPVPRFSSTPGAIQRPPAKTGEHNETALKDWGFRAEEIHQLKLDGAM